MTWAEFVSHVNKYLRDNNIGEDCLLEYIDLRHYTEERELQCHFDDKTGLFVQS